MNAAKKDAIKKVKGYIDEALRAEVDEILDDDINRAEWWTSLDDYLLNDDAGKDQQGNPKPTIAERLSGKGPQFKTAVKQGAAYGLMWGKGIMRIGGYGAALDCKVDSRGLLKLIFKAGVYTSADRVVVFKGERFQPLPTANPPRIIHHPSYEVDRSRANNTAAYIILRGPNVLDKFLVVDREQIARVAEAGGSLYMGPDWQEMVKWIPLRKIVKELDDNPRLEMAVHAAKAAFDGDYRDETPADDPGGSITDRAIDHGAGDDAPLPGAADAADEEV
jgi:hypothetical protein